MPTWIWVTGVSLLAGVIVAIAAGGATLGWLVFASAALVFAAGVAGIHSATQRRRLHREFEYTPAVVRPGVRDLDLQIAAQVDALLRDRGLPWLRSETFALGWRDAQVRPFRELAELLDNRPTIADFQLDVSLEDLAASVRTFITVYDECTRPDPLLLEGGWRIMRPGAEPPDETGYGAPEADRLRVEAASIVSRYLEVRTAAQRIARAI